MEAEFQGSVTTEKVALQDFLENAASYERTLRACAEQIDQLLASRTAREGSMRYALSSAISAPVTAVLFRTPYFQNKQGDSVPPMPSELETNDMTRFEDPHETRIVWTNDQDKILRELVTERKRERRRVQLFTVKMGLDKHHKDLRRIFDFLNGSGDSVGADVLPVEIMDSADFSKSGQDALLEVLASSSPKECCGKLLTEMEKTVNDLILEMESVNDLSKPYPESKMHGIELMKYDWFNIARHLRLKRHGEDSCRIRYLNLLDPGLKSPKKWTKKDQHTLVELVNQNGQHNWDLIAQQIPGRTALACCSQFVVSHTEKPDDTSDRNSYSFTAEEVIRLIHAYHVTQGVWSNIQCFLPGKSATLCRKFWETNLDPDANRNAWTEKELSALRKFARNKKGLAARPAAEISGAIPGRSHYHIQQVFHGMFQRSPDGRWTENETCRVNVKSQEHKSAMIVTLVDHVLSAVTEQLKDDPQVTMEDLLAEPQVVTPVRKLLRDLDLLPLSERPGPGVADHDLQFIKKSLSPSDHRLGELFAAPLIQRPSHRGRKRRENLFGTIPLELQPENAEKRQEIIRTVLTEEHDRNPESQLSSQILLPPSLATIGAFVKLKELLSGISAMEEETIRATFEAQDLLPMQRVMESLFLTTELLRLTTKQRGEQQNACQTSEPPVRKQKSTAGRSRHVSGRTQARRRLKGRQDLKAKRKEDRENRKRSAKETGNPVPKRKKAEESTVSMIQRRSSRLASK